MLKPKTETRYRLRADHPEFEDKNCFAGDEFTLVGQYRLRQVGLKKEIKFSKAMFEVLMSKKYLEKYEYEFPLPPNEDIILAKGVKVEGSTFDRSPNGGMVDFKVPKDCDGVILMGNKGGGYSPERYLLPHQVYVNDLRELAKKEGYEVFYIVPVKSSQPFPIAYVGDYGKQRWENK